MNNDDTLSNTQSISLLSLLYDMSNDKFNHVITNEEINNFNIYKNCSCEIIELSLHHLLSSYEYNSRQGYMSSLVIFNDFIKKTIQLNSKDALISSYLSSLFNKRIFFIPIFDTIKSKWSLVIIDSFNLLFKEDNAINNHKTETIEEESDDEQYSNQPQFRLIYFTSTNKKDVLYTLINNLKQYFIF